MKNHAYHHENHATNHATNAAVIGKPRQPRQNALVYACACARVLVGKLKTPLMCVSGVVGVVGVVFINNQIVKQNLGVVCGVVFCLSGVVFEN